MSVSDVNPRNSSRIIFWLGGSTKGPPMDDCYVPKISEVSSAKTEKLVELFTAVTRSFLKTSSDMLISSFCVRCDVYRAFLEAVSKWVFNMVSPALIRKSKSCCRFPFPSSFPRKARSFVPQNKIAERIENILFLFSSIVGLIEESNWHYDFSIWIPLSCHRVFCIFLRTNMPCRWYMIRTLSWKSLYFVKAQVMNAPW